MVLSQRTGPKGITPAGRAWKGIFQQEAVDSPGPKKRELVGNDGAWLRTVLPAGDTATPAGQPMGQELGCPRCGDAGRMDMPMGLGG